MNSEDESQNNKKKQTDAQAMLWALKKAAIYCPGKLAVWCVICLVNAFLAPAYLLLSRKLIDRIISSGSSSLAALVLSVSLLAFTLFLKSCYGIMQNLFSELLTIVIQSGISREIMVKSHKIPIKRFDDDNFIKFLYLAANSDNAMSTAVLVEGGIAFFGQCLSIMYLIVMAAQTSAVFLLTSIPLVILSLIVGVSNARRQYQTARDNVVEGMWKSYYFSIGQSMYEGMDVRNMNLSDLFIRKWRTHADRLRDKIMTQEKRHIGHNAGVSLLGVVSSTVMLLIGVFMLKGRLITIGTLFMIWQLNGELQSTINSLAQTFYTPYSGIPKVKDTKAFLAMDFDDNYMQSFLTEKYRCRLLPEKPVFSLRNVSFGYEKGIEVLHNISMDIKPGQIIALCGPNGSGKSTLINMLSAMYAPTKGELFHQGVPYHKLSRSQLCDEAGVNFQHFEVFGYRLKEEVGMGQIRDVGNTNRVMEAIEKADATAILKRSPHGLDEHIGTEYDINGLHVSGGEYQRIGVGRAFMGGKSILILDEPASMLDPIAEYKQFMQIKEAIAGQSAILISHRIGFARLANRILVMNEGKIAEDGTHAQLIAKNGLYAKMFRAQAEWYEDLDDNQEGHIS